MLVVVHWVELKVIVSDFDEAFEISNSKDITKSGSKWRVRRPGVLCAELAGTVFGAAEPAVNGLPGSDVAADVAAVSDALAEDAAVPLP